MSIPYRTQQNLKRLAITLLILLVVGAIVWGLWVVWLQRFVVYTRDEGAVIDFELSQTLSPGEEAIPPEEGVQIEIHYNEGDDKVNISTELAQLNGYYVSSSTVSSDPAAVWEQIQALPANTPVMLDVKSIYGTFYYSTGTGRPLSDSADILGVDQLIANLRSSGYYTIARVPALRDKEFGRENTRSGLPTSGGYLWMDDEGCYWLNPAKEDTITYLIDIATELRELGFNEVVFEDFYFPSTKKIVFKGDKLQTLADAAQALVTNCATDYFAVSFVSDGTWTAPTGRSRVYREDVADPVQLLEVTQNLTLTDPSIRLVFITSNMDTRFEAYGVMRPINLAH